MLNAPFLGLLLLLRLPLLVSVLTHRLEAKQSIALDLDLYSLGVLPRCWSLALMFWSFTSVGTRGLGKNTRLPSPFAQKGGKSQHYLLLRVTMLRSQSWIWCVYRVSVQFWTQTLGYLAGSLSLDGNVWEKIRGSHDPHSSGFYT